MGERIMHTEWYDRLRLWIRVLQEDFYHPIGEIVWKAWLTMDEVPPEALNYSEFRTVAPGFIWGHTWEYGWFHSLITIPEEAAGQRIVMRLHPNAESTLFVNGRAFGTYRAPGIKEKHHYDIDNVLTRCAKAEETFDILMETYAGHFIPETGIGPILDEEHYGDKKTEGARCTLGECTYGIWNETAYQLYMDVSTLAKLMDSIDQNSLRAAHIADALEKFTLVVDFEQPPDRRMEMYERAREILKPVLSMQNCTAPDFYAFGHAHLDLAWLWPMAETHRKTVRTFAAQLRLMEEYPEYQFVQSQPAAYEMCREHYPELFERIRKAVKEGRWIAEGGMWVEPDTNMIGGEAMIRQMLYGRRYFREVFGKESEVLFLPDSFGYSAALPQIMQGCGIKYIITSKIYWNYNDGEEFPYHYFHWQGIDGTQVTAFLPTAYGYQTHPQRLNEVWNTRRQRRGLDAFLIPFGYGDGGGGPTRDHIEYALREKNLEGCVKVRMTSPKTFFDDMENKGGPKQTYTGELYFNAHRGTYTTQAKIKENNRRAEAVLQEMDLYGALAQLFSERNYVYDQVRAEQLWKILLLHQFHDILPGSSIHRVYVEAEKAVEDMMNTARAIADEARSCLMEDNHSGAISVFNSLSFARHTCIELPACFADGAVTAEGEYVPVDDLKANVQLLPIGALVLEPAMEKKPGNPSVTARRAESGYVLENRLVRVFVDDMGHITSMFLKKSGREFAGGSMNVLRIFQDISRDNDAWDIDTPCMESELSGCFDVKITIPKASSEVCCSLIVQGCISNSTYSQKIVLYADSPRLDFETTINWKELHRVLKADFPVRITTTEGINEIQFGYIKRPTHRSRQYDKDRYEVCNHRYSALAADSHGAAILNDSKYGISMRDNHLALTLLKAAASPDFRTDNRIHEFTYSFYPFEGHFSDAGVQREAISLNVKPCLMQGRAKYASLFHVDQPNIILDTVKLAEDGSGDPVLRLYQSMDQEDTVRLSGPLLNGNAWLTDMEEKPLQALGDVSNGLTLSFKPFEICTLRIHRTNPFSF